MGVVEKGSWRGKLIRLVLERYAGLWVCLLQSKVGNRSGSQRSKQPPLECCLAQSQVILAEGL